MPLWTSGGRAAAAIVLCLAFALGGQVMADALVPGASGQDTNAAVGRAASSYLTGIKRYAASALWNRIDPIMHRYYGGVALPEMRYLLSTVALVEALDPTFTQSYYVGSWILIQNDRLGAGLAMAERGVREVPTSGLLLTNLAQIQYLYADDPVGAFETAQAALDPAVAWESASEEYDGYIVFRDIFKATDHPDLASAMEAEMVRLDEEIEEDPDEADKGHDHDNDGVPDH